MKTVGTFLLLLASSVAPLLAAAPVWDTTGNSLLSGDYHFREVAYVSDSSGNTSRALSVFGTISFNAGTYTLSGLGGADSGSSSGAPTLSTTTTYSLSSSGFGFLSDPLSSNSSISILVSNGVIVGSATEAGFNSTFIAARVTSLSTSSFSGAYTASAFVPGGSAAGSIGATYQLNPDGNGHLGNFTISGFTGGGQSISQNASGIAYKVPTNANAVVIAYPTNSSALVYPEQVFVYFSPDTNFIFGGTEHGFDMFVGVKNASSGSSTPLSGLYYEAGMEQFGSIDSYYGALNTAGDGNLVANERIYYAGYSAQGTTYYSSYPTTLAGNYQDPSGSVQYTIGQNGFRIGYGIGNQYLSMSVAMPYTPPGAGGAAVYLDPTGIVNTASSAPYTAGIAPGEFLTFYNGVNMAPSAAEATGVPYPTSLNGVKVLIDGIAAPIYVVSPTQVSVVVPYDVTAFPFASIQINNNGVLSNTVTMAVNKTSGGVFTSDPIGGYGVSALLDFPASGGYYVVDNDHPAHPGDNVAAYLTGLGVPFPSSINAGAPGPGDGDQLTQTIYVDVSGTDVGTPGYAGLAPLLAGLYQINFTIPSTTTAGNNTLGISGPDSYTSESYIPIVLSGSAVESSHPVANARHQGRPRIGRELHR